MVISLYFHCKFGELWPVNVKTCDRQQTDDLWWSSVLNLQNCSVAVKWSRLCSFPFWAWYILSYVFKTLTSPALVLEVFISVLWRWLEIRSSAGTSRWRKALVMKWGREGERLVPREAAEQRRDGELYTRAVRASVSGQTRGFSLKTAAADRV